VKEDRRLFHRIRKELPLKVKFLGYLIEGKSYDLSAKGIGVILDRPLPYKERVELSILSSEARKKIDLEGRVVWYKELDRDCWRIGIEVDNPQFLLFSKLLG